jgi:hypothetical protein
MMWKVDSQQPSQAPPIGTGRFVLCFGFSCTEGISIYLSIIQASRQAGEQALPGVQDSVEMTSLRSLLVMCDGGMWRKTERLMRQGLNHSYNKAEAAAAGAGDATSTHQHKTDTIRKEDETR